MEKRVLILLLFCGAITNGFAQLTRFSFEEVAILNQKKPKPTLIFIHTSWCKYCKMMEKSALQNPNVIQLLNEKFYFISLDAESKKDITFHNHTFKFKPTGTTTGIHELATELATVNNEIVYPTIAVLDSSFSILFQKQSYLNTEELLFILQKIE